MQVSSAIHSCATISPGLCNLYVVRSLWPFKSGEETRPRSFCALTNQVIETFLRTLRFEIACDAKSALGDVVNLSVAYQPSLVDGIVSLTSTF